jgi:hypothetical protein
VALAGLFRAVKRSRHGMDGRVKPGHDGGEVAVVGFDPRECRRRNTLRYSALHARFDADVVTRVLPVKPRDDGVGESRHGLRGVSVCATRHTSPMGRGREPGLCRASG